MISDGGVDWVAEVAGGAVVEVRRLPGGTHAETWLVSTDGEPGEVVLRRYPDGDPAPARETAILGALDGLGGLAPRLIAADLDGKRCGGPAVLISRLPGRADIAARPARITTKAADPRAAGLGWGLARVHAVGPAGMPALRDGLVVAGHGRVSEELAGRERVLTHLDYWSGNVLWDGDRLSGIVDWSGACLAPRGLDVSWCRLDLALLHGPSAAGEFLDAYQRAAGVRVPDMAAWDRFAGDNSAGTVEEWTEYYRDLGRADLTPAELRRRHDAWRAAT